YRYITIVINYLIKIRYYILIETLETDEFVEKFIERIYNIYELPNNIVSNQSSQFISIL
ncbi:hypothetical protein NEUTE2DRAFT_63876, partial [Neurospora tetrasperma FGSC 2509]